MATPTPSPRRSVPVVAGALVILLAALAAAAVVVAALPGLPEPLGSGPPPSFVVRVPDTEVLLGAGDIARCDSDQDEATARLLDALGGTVFTAGDNAYESGTRDAFARCYEPTWGRHRERTRFPTAGNHDWATSGAAGYLDYFGAAAQADGVTWYARPLGAWLVVVLDSNCSSVGGCGEGSPQLDWLRGQLEASDARCSLAIWHHPRFSSGEHGSDARSDAFWRLLHEHGAEVVVGGHDHDYERFAPQDPDGQPDPERGIRQFVVGTGGTRLRDFDRVAANSEVREDRTHGVLRLELGPDGYAWAFVPVAGRAFTDAGSGRCH